MSLASRCMDTGATLVNPFGYFFELPMRALAAVALGGREVVVRGQKNGRPGVRQLVSRPLPRAGRDFFWTRPPADMGIWLLIVCAARKGLQRLLKTKELSFSRMCISLIRKATSEMQHGWLPHSRENVGSKERSTAALAWRRSGLDGCLLHTST
jgi:hypothetical protein